MPDGVVGLVGSDAPDVLAHLSVRARNMHVLFAACYDETPLAELAAMAGKAVNIATTAGGALLLTVHAAFVVMAMLSIALAWVDLPSSVACFFQPKYWWWWWCHFNNCTTLKL